ncbi:MAG: acetyltransferase [Acidobacteriota bacterium]|nr:acetyltransferase [Acidobacteriota bacterium]
MKDLFIFGCGGHAKVVSAVVEAEGVYRIAGYVETEVTADRFLDLPRISESEYLAKHKQTPLLVAVGENAIRGQVVRRLTLSGGLTYPTAVHPSAVIHPSVTLGRGTVVMPHVTINPDSRVGDFCVINTNAVLEHDCRLADLVSLAPSSTVCGGCTIGEGAYIGAGATIIHNRNIGAWSVLAAGSVATVDLGEMVVARGLPARVKRQKQADERVL